MNMICTFKVIFAYNCSHYMGQWRSQNFCEGGTKFHIIFSYILNILSNFPAQGHIKVNDEVEKNYSDNVGIEFVVEIKKYVSI